MPSANRLTTPVSVDLPLIQARYAELDGYTVGFESYPEDVDPAPFFVGLPDDRCQCAHWGVVQTGRITFRWADHEETYAAGDAYYAAPGHLPLIAAGTSVVEFSPSDALARTMTVIEANLAAAGSARWSSNYKATRIVLRTRCRPSGIGASACMFLRWSAPPTLTTALGDQGR